MDHNRWFFFKLHKVKNPFVWKDSNKKLLHNLMRCPPNLGLEDAIQQGYSKRLKPIANSTTSVETTWVMANVDFFFFWSPPFLAPSFSLPCLSGNRLALFEKKKSATDSLICQWLISFSSIGNRTNRNHWLKQVTIKLLFPLFLKVILVVLGWEYSRIHIQIKHPPNYNHMLKISKSWEHTNHIKIFTT